VKDPYPRSFVSSACTDCIKMISNPRREQHGRRG
jgi:hypothetical protein